MAGLPTPAAVLSETLPRDWRGLKVHDLRRLVAGRGPGHMPHYSYRRRWQIVKWIEEHLEEERPPSCPTCGRFL